MIQIEVNVFTISYAHSYDMRLNQEVEYWLYYENETGIHRLCMIHYDNQIHFKENIACRRIGTGDDILQFDQVYHFYCEEDIYVLIKRKSLQVTSIYDLTKNRITIGRNERCDICLHYTFVSNQHAILYQEDDHWYIQDVNSKNGTYINKKRIQKQQLNCGDIILIMGTYILFLDTSIVIYVDVNSMQVPLPIHNMDLTKYPQRNMHYVFHHSLHDTPFTFRKFNIELPTVFQNERQMPFWLQLAPMIVMGLSAGCMALMSFLQMRNQSMDMYTSFSSIIMCMSMMLCSMCFPMLQHRFDRKNKILNQKTYEQAYIKYLTQQQEQIDFYVKSYQQWVQQHTITLQQCIQNIDQYKDIYINDIDTKNHLQITLGSMNQQFPIDFVEREDHIQIQKNILTDAYENFIQNHIYDLYIPYAYSLQNKRILHIIGKYARKLTRQYVLQLLSMEDYRDTKLVIFDHKNKVNEWNFSFMRHIIDEEYNIRYIFNYSKDLAYFERYLQVEATKKKPRHFIMIDTLFTKDLNMDLLFSKYPFIYGIRCMQEESEYVGNCYIDASDEEHIEWINDGKRNEITCFDGNKEDIDKAIEKLNTIEIMDSNTKWKNLTFLELHDCDYVGELDCVSRYQKNRFIKSIKGCIGVDGYGEKIYLDIHEGKYGPHGLIAGMTGSGKSELLMTFILSLCVNYSCEEVSFFLIDYKGGMMANAFASLPHIAGILTNLEDGIMRRIMQSLQAELDNRQKLFIDTQQQYHYSQLDMDGYQQLRKLHQDLKPLPHLIIIADEFAELKSQQQSFMQHLKRIARIGRSLGIHLILATQKPYGVVDDEIWSNSRFHICLKVQNENDSMDMLKNDDAVRLEKSGQFYLQVGNELYMKGRSSLTSAPYSKDEILHKRKKEMIIYDQQCQIKKIKNIPYTYNMTQLQATISYLCNIDQKMGYQHPFLYLPMLNKDGIQEVASTNDHLCMGVVDDVKQQKQYPFYMHDHKHMLICGMQESGKYTFLETFIWELQRTHPKTIVYVLDSEGIRFPTLYKHTFIQDVIERKSKEKYESLLYQCNHTIFPHDVYLIIYGYEQWVNYDEYLQDQLVNLLSNSKKNHIHIIITANSIMDIHYRLMTYFDDIYLLQHSEISDYSYFHLQSEDVVPLHQAGSGIFKKDDVYLFQIYPYHQKLKELHDYKQEKNFKIPILPKEIQIQWKKDYLYIGKELQSKQDIWISLQEKVMIVCAYDIDMCIYQSLLGYIKKYEKVEYAIDCMNIEDCTCNLLFYTLPTLQQVYSSHTFMKFLFDCKIIWVGKGIEEAMHMLKLPMDCQKKNMEEDMLYVCCKGEGMWVKGVRRIGK